MTKITFSEIEERISELPIIAEEIACGEVNLQELVILFAILKVGTSPRDLSAFTGYRPSFVIDRLTALSNCGAMNGSNNLSLDYVLRECPGSEDLIFACTGERLGVLPSVPSKISIEQLPNAKLKKETPMQIENQITVEATTPVAETCWCGRKARHRGQHLKPGERGKNGRLKHPRVSVARKRKVSRPLRPAAGGGTAREKILAAAENVVNHLTTIRPENLTRKAATNGSNGHNTGRSQKTFKVEGGSITLSVDIDILNIARPDRDFLFGLVDQIEDRFAQRVGPPDERHS